MVIEHHTKTDKFKKTQQVIADRKITKRSRSCHIRRVILRMLQNTDMLSCFSSMQQTHIVSRCIRCAGDDKYMSLDLTSLENAVSNLEEVLEAYDDETTQKNPNYKKHMRGASIHYFEYTYELSLKLMRRYLKMSSDSDVMIDDMTFSDVIRAAYAKKIILSDLQTWRTYRKKRGITSHTYDDAKAQDVFADIPNFLDEVRHVLARLQELSKSLD